MSVPCARSTPQAHPSRPQPRARHRSAGGHDPADRQPGRAPPPPRPGTASHGASPAATGTSTPATATTAACSSPTARGCPTAAASTPPAPTGPPRPSRSPSPSACSTPVAGGRGRPARRKLGLDRSDAKGSPSGTAAAASRSKARKATHQGQAGEHAAAPAARSTPYGGATPCRASRPAATCRAAGRSCTRSTSGRSAATPA